MAFVHAMGFGDYGSGIRDSGRNFGFNKHVAKVGGSSESQHGRCGEYRVEFAIGGDKGLVFMDN